MECTRCRAAFVGADGRCPRCDGPPAQGAYAPPQAPPQPNPYAPPQYGAMPPPGPGPAGMYPAPPPAPYGGGYPAMLRPPARLAGLSTAVTVLFALVAVLALLRVIADYRLYDALGSIWTTDLAEADSIDDFRATTIVLLFVGFLAAAPVFLVWFHKARANVEGLGPHRHSTGMAVGAWFIPFANWWIPKAITDDVVSASQGVQRPGGLGAVNGWWACWVLSSVLAGIGWPMYSSSMDESDPSLEGARTASLVLMGSNLALIAAGICAILAVRTISAVQDARFGLGPAGPAPGPAPYPGQGW
ncbi:DUF4328 domain-containing protein [Streptomyces sp. NPDC050400]|uniref:DUF4328 domain-containing protein n=1 Tax=Streptomyces sp. NPDC050400 TaxID=3365610 RepID=UPI0037A6B2FB